MLRDPEKDPRPLARELYGWIIEPIAIALKQAGIKTIMFPLDDQLRYVPMAGLHDGARWLVQEYNVSLFNEATMAALAVPAVGD